MSRPIPTTFDGKRELRVTRLSVVTPGDGQMFSEMTTHVEIEDEAGGEFVVVRQQSMHTKPRDQTISIDDLDWPALRAAIDWMLGECRDEIGRTPK